MKKIRILGVPMDLGQNRRGVDMGPSALRYAGIKGRLERLGYQVEDAGNVTVPNREERVADTSDKQLDAVTVVCDQVYERGQKLFADEAFVLFLGGDHSISIGSVKAAQQHGVTGLIWVDAHADYNTFETSPSGNIHGMPVAVLTGDGAESLTSIGGLPSFTRENIVQVGIRDLDRSEQERLVDSGIHVHTMRHIDERGMAAIAHETLAALAHCDRIHVSLDLDGLDPDDAPGVGTPVNGGLTYREAHLLMEILGDSGKVISADIVEVNPILDRRNHTAELGVELIASLLGKRIL